jgi:uncharacterized SAM-binding protein YcdF (DUF218 family)
MTLQTRRFAILAAVLIVAGMLAFPLRDTIYQMVVVPAALIAWYFNLLYRSFSQGMWWWLVVFVVLLMVFFSLMPRPSSRTRPEAKRKPPQGQVEALAVWLGRTERGIYFKWLVANRLGKLAYQILLHRESGRPRSIFAPLTGVDWEPTGELQKYLETGLHGSFADFPNVDRRFGAPQRTPLDLDVAEAVEFLESQVQNGSNHG